MARQQQQQQQQHHHQQQQHRQQTHHEVQGTIGVTYGNLEMGTPIIIEVCSLLRFVNILYILKPVRANLAIKLQHTCKFSHNVS